ncbi:MacB family efflux pump subunit [Falsirhodobacter sp. 1013]|uniref:MacB family efflux pump subunit n=1 Tax=Falsirhodobacter sp. 1013 TaxID=3417566 RepID=UPI003EBA6DBF
MEPLIRIRGIRREYAAGDQRIAVLKDVDLDIHAGEMLAIVGQSGSGKSTLMNILGFLDRPNAGTYRFGGREIGDLAPDDLAELRREHFGFIFQRYQLLGDLDAVGNVEVPAIYKGVARGARRERARALLTRLGLGERLDHRPGELSGGQQQRVSVARALMNGGEVILADEPTGALDTVSGAELMRLLQELHAEGHTIVIVTHDPGIAAQCDRIVEMRDGVIVSDSAAGATAAPRAAAPSRRALAPGLDRLREAFGMAVKAMAAHRMRSFLTMLGIIIGIASVVSVVALGSGSQQQVLANISNIGSNTIDIRNGSGFGDRSANRIRALTAEDAEALAVQPYAAGVSPTVSASATIRFGATELSASVTGVGVEYFAARAFKTVGGATFDATAVSHYAQEAVIDTDGATALFGAADPVGQVVMMGRVPVRILGVVEASGTSFGPQSALNLFIPYTTAMARLSGQDYVNSISVRVADDFDMDTAEALITQLLTTRHGKQDFFLTNTDTIREAITSTTRTLTMLIAGIAVISLFVGGVGVMNIMLVSVTERTKEIGVRIAVGARRADIITQFLIEAVLVCLLGGVLGITLALGLGWALQAAIPQMSLIYSSTSIIAAVVSSSVIGVTFGFLPARAASRLDPVEALTRE